ncbi:MAG TPA: aminotransferase class V-fold PLP-dependent enzyme [Acidimicrobiales bacterium]|nr:aminotransferase class V-fold PLP-dependent enzyme [Acidimicrobiales bacterium]
MHEEGKSSGSGAIFTEEAAPLGPGLARANPPSANPIWGDDWEEVRRLWLLDPEVAHCNHGSFGALPARVLARQDELRRRIAVNPMRWFDGEMPGLLSEARAEVARFIGAGVDDVAFVNNVSAGVSAVVQSLPLTAGDEVLSTDHAYGAVSSALDRLCARTGARRVVAPVPVNSRDDEVVAIFAEHCSERTALVVVDQVTSPTARRFPVAAVAAVAHRAGAVALVDAAHAPGMLALDVPSIGADFWVGNLHKWACAPVGTGVLWVTPAWHERMLSLVVNWGEAEGFPKSFERVGTDDLTGWIVAPRSIELLASLGWDRVRAHNEALVCAGQATVADMLGTRLDGLRHDAGLSMALVPLPPGLADTREQAQSLKAEMAARGVEMSVGSWEGRGRVRLSAHVYNCPADYERMALGIREIMAG